MKSKNNKFLHLIEEVLLTFRKSVQTELSKLSPGLTYDQFQLLRAFFKNQNYTLTEVSSALLKDTASVTRMMDLLEQKGYIFREAATGDKRSKKITLSDKGKEVLLLTGSKADIVTKNAFRDIDSRQLKKHSKILKTINVNLKNLDPTEKNGK